MPVASFEVVKLNAGNDRNGNPRRLWLSLLGGSVVRAFPENYDGLHAVREGRERELARTCPEIRVSASEYRRLLRMYGPAEEA